MITGMSMEMRESDRIYFIGQFPFHDKFRMMSMARIKGRNEELYENYQR
jgi:hypothetical protein